MKKEEHYKFKGKRWTDMNDKKSEDATEKLLSALLGEKVSIKDKKER